jgi:ribA/ribD-fused uncharacterized protein
MLTIPERKVWSEEDGTAFLSNFSLSQVALDTPDEPFDSFVVPTVEHAYQASKTIDALQRWDILEAATPGQAKRMGRQVTLRPDWELVKQEIMRRHLKQKFSNLALARKLFAVQGEIVEWNTWHDTVWGKCICEDHDGAGQNLLGKLLMEIRDGTAGAT